MKNKTSSSRKSGSALVEFSAFAFLFFIFSILAVHKAHATPGTFLQTPVLKLPIVYQDFGGTPPAQTSPYVQVTTTTVAVLPFRPLSFLAGGTILQDGMIPFTQTYTFPIVRVK